MTNRISTSRPAITDRKRGTRDAESIALHAFVLLFANLGDVGRFEDAHGAEVADLTGAARYNRLADIRRAEVA